MADDPNTTAYEGTVPTEEEARAAEQREANLAALQRKTEIGACQMCGGDSWNMGDIVDIATRLAGSESPNLFAATRALPAVPVQCTNCGFTLLFNTIFLRREGEESKT